MLIVRATKKLRDRLGPPDLHDGERSTTVLGDWYATRFAWRPDVLLLVNEPTLYPILLPLAPAGTALARAVDRIAAAMATYGATEAMIEAEVEHMTTRRIGPTANRSVVGIMTEFTFLADHARQQGRDLDALGSWLVTVPCSPLYRTHTTPQAAFRHRISSMSAHRSDPPQPIAGQPGITDGPDRSQTPIA